MNVAHLLISQSTLRPRAPAIVERSGRRSRSITFESLDVRSAQASAMLSARGIGAGDAVLVFVPMSIELYVALIALLRIGAVATFLDPSAGREHISRCCEILPPAGMIAISRAHLLRLTTPALRIIRRSFTVGFPLPGADRWEHLTRHAPFVQITPRASDDGALVTFTSGSTGRPKAAVRSHGFLAAQHAALQPAIDLAPGQVDLATLPIFTLVNLASGVTSVIADTDLKRPGSVRPAPVLRQVLEHHVTRTVASPAFLECLLKSPSVVPAMQKLDRVYTGGAPIFPGLMKRLQQALPQAQVVAVYGSTEAEPIAHVAWQDITAQDLAAMFNGRGLLAGHPDPQIDLRIVRATWGQPLANMTCEQLNSITCTEAEPGEIVVTGPHVLRGYLNGEGDSQTKCSVDGNVWHRTGDAGYLDERGRLWLLGRAQAKIVDEHGTLYPFTVECAASQNQGLRRSALVQHQGKRLLVVEADNGASSHLLQQITDTLAWARLHEVRLIRRIPVDKRHNAKIDYAALHRLL